MMEKGFPRLILGKRFATGCLLIASLVAGSGPLIAAEIRDIRYSDNRIEGFAVPVSDLRKA